MTEITGSVRVNGNNVVPVSSQLGLRWNAANRSDRIEIIIGGVIPGTADTFPLLSIRTRDDGELNVPQSVIETIPYENFDTIVISFVRQKETSGVDNELGDYYILSQSVHNIRLNID